MSIVLIGSTSGSITLQEPAVAGTTVLTLPTTSGTLITTASSGQSIPRAALPTGSVLQVVSITKTDKFTTTSSSAVDITGLSVTITPTSASSKILIMTDINYGGDANMYAAFFVVRNSTNVVVGTYPTGNQTAATFGGGVPSDTYKIYSGSHRYLDSPNTTSATTYKVQAATTYNSLTLTVNAPYQTNDASYIIGGTSTITVMEIAA